ncbi:MAG: conjugal transfer protein TraF [Oceanococcaceae bacterium]
MRRIFGAVLLVSSCVVGATPGPVHQGAGTSLGTVLGSAVPGIRHNPASGAVALRNGQRFRASILSVVNLSLEAGPVDSFIERIEDLEGCLDEDQATCRDAAGNPLLNDRPGIDLDEADRLKIAFDELLVDIGRDAYVIIGAQLQLPSTPMLFRAFGGVMGVDIHGSGLANVSVLDDPLRYNPLTETIDTRTAAYLKTARFINVGLSWSRPVEIPIERVIPGMYTRGDFYLGGRLTLLNGTLAKVIAAIDSEDDNGDSAFDRAEDAYEDAEESSTNVALDVGLQWVHEGMQAGVTLRNINNPSFDFGAVGVDCDRAGLGMGARQDCLVAASFADRIDLRESFEMNPQLTVDADIPLGRPDIRLAGSWDLNAANSPVGDEYQWLSVGLRYVPSNWLIPGVRVGYRSNLSGTGIDSFGLGLTLFGYFHLDASQSSDSVVVDGDKLPRAASVSLRFEAPL